MAGLDELRAAVTLRAPGLATFGVIALLACDPANSSRGPGPSPHPAIAALPAPASNGGSSARTYTLDEKLAMFREGLAAPTTLSEGATSREALVRQFVDAVERRDTALVRAMVLDRAEFAWLYYPDSPYTRPPTLQEAPLAWFLVVENSQKGITRAFNRFGGSGIEYADLRCDPEPIREGRNLFWRDCVVVLNTRLEGRVTRRLFGNIMERDGRFKFFSYTNDF